MQEHDLFKEFQNAVAGNKALGDDKSPPVFHGDQRVRAAIYSVLGTTHRHIFESDNVKDLATAKEKFLAVMALCEPDIEK